MEGSKQQFNFNSVSMVVYLWKNKKIIILATIAAAILSAGVSFLVPNKYASKAIVFPVSEGTASYDLLTIGSKPDGLNLGKEEEVDQMLQIFESDDIVEYIIEKYDLYKHYEIDTLEDVYYKHSVKEKYKKRVDVTATKFMSIQIYVTDKDPEMAAAIANEVAEYGNKVVSELFRKKAEEAFKLVENEYNLVNEKILFLEDSLQSLREYGILDYVTQTERYTQALGLALVENNTKAERIITQKMDLLAKYGGSYLDMRDDLILYKQRFKDLNAQYAEAKVDANDNLDRLFIVNRARVEEKKAAPKRLIIVLTSVIITFLFAAIVLLINDSVKTYIREE